MLLQTFSFKIYHYINFLRYVEFILWFKCINFQTSIRTHSLIHSFTHLNHKLIIAEKEFFFFVLLPPIIFEAGYGLDRSLFFENIGAITIYAMFGTIISTFIVGYSTFYVARAGWVTGISTTNPMEALLFGALISAVDPVATLSIMGNPELQCNRQLYSLVFGESVLNVSWINTTKYQWIYETIFYLLFVAVLYLLIHLQRTPLQWSYSKHFINITILKHQT